MMQSPHNGAYAITEREMAVMDIEEALYENVYGCPGCRAADRYCHGCGGCEKHCPSYGNCPEPWMFL